MTRTEKLARELADRNTIWIGGVVPKDWAQRVARAYLRLLKSTNYCGADGRCRRQ